MSKRKPEQERHLGKNVVSRVKTTQDGQKFLLIRVNLGKRYGESSTGKSNIVASTRGCVRVPGEEKLRYAVNAFEVK